MTTADVYSRFRLLALGSVNNTLVQAGKTRLIGGIISNTSASARYFKLYDKATAPVAGSDTPVQTIYLPAASNTPIQPFVAEGGEVFALGLGFALTNLQADADTTALTAGDVVVNLLFENA